jgi:hypothetical protein
MQSHRHEARIQIVSAPVTNDIVQQPMYPPAPVQQPMYPPESSPLPPSYSKGVNQEYQQQPSYNPNFPINGPH